MAPRRPRGKYVLAQLGPLCEDCAFLVRGTWLPSDCRPSSSQGHSNVIMTARGGAFGHKARSRAPPLAARARRRGRRGLGAEGPRRQVVLPIPVVLPVPCFNAVNDGSHAGNELAFQGYFIISVQRRARGPRQQCVQRRAESHRPSLLRWAHLEPLHPSHDQSIIKKSTFPRKGLGDTAFGLPLAGPLGLQSWQRLTLGPR